MTDPTPTGPGRSRRRGAVLTAALVLSAVAASAAGSAALSEEAPVPLEQQMESEIDAMVDGGMSPDDPKVEMLEEQLDELEDGADADAPTDPGAAQVDDLLEQAEAEEASEDAAIASRSAGPETAPGDGAGGAAAPGGAEWDSGEILCEPIPGLLAADEIAGARCIGVPQPDGTSRYMALLPDGTARTVAFGHDGQVQRLPDTSVGVPVTPETRATPTPQGDLTVTPPGAAARTVDVR